MTERESLTQLADAAAIQRTVQALQQRNIHVVVAEGAADALREVIQLLPEGAEVFVGTSETLDAIGFGEYFQGNPKYVDIRARNRAEADPARQQELRRMTSVADHYLGSVHAIAETGEVVIASGSGSQLGAYVYGARRVIWVAGTQKICPTLADAVARVRGYSLERHDEWAAASGRRGGAIGKLLIVENEQNPERLHLVLVKQQVGW